jgi:hypothetical protein
VELAEACLRVFRVGQNRPVKRERDHSHGRVVRQLELATSVVQIVAIVLPVDLQRPFKPLTAWLEVGRRIERNIEPGDGSQWNTVKGYVDTLHGIDPPRRD